MKFSYNWLQKNIQKKLPEADKLAELISLHIFEVTSVEKQNGDWILDIDVLPNRSDCLSHFGLCREIAAGIGSSLVPLKKKKIVKQKGSIKPIDLKIQCGQLVSRFSAILIENTEIRKTSEWIS